MTPPKDIHRIGILTGGGDCPGLNAVIRAVAKTAMRQYGIECVGIEDGFYGLIENQTRPLSFKDVSGILTRGGTDPRQPQQGQSGEVLRRERRERRTDLP
jgi:6-phosphofructokinase